jgi:ribokinase
MRAAVVGHLEWVVFMRVDHMPSAGEIVHASEWWEEAGGGGAVTAVQLAKLAGDATFFTALGDDELGHHAHERLVDLGLDVEAVFRPEQSRRAITHVDATGERTITVLGERLAPRLSDPLAWDRLDGSDVVYFTAGDADVLRRARSARVLVATSRVLPVLAESGVELDALVGSAIDPSEIYRKGDLNPSPRLVVRTEGADGGTFEVGGQSSKRLSGVQPPGPIVDRYGAGDSFAGGLAYALARGDWPEGAIGFGARCGAAVVTGRGPYEAQLRA